MPTKATSAATMTQPTMRTSTIRSCGSGNLRARDRSGRYESEKFASQTLDNDRRRHAAACAHRDQAALQIAPLELVQHRADQHGAGGADRMAERHGAAVHV